MKFYELVIETTQPPCGGKPPRLYEFLEIQIEDPMEYVKSRESDCEPVLESNVNGEIVITVDAGAHHVKYEFTEV